ncbi:MAG: DUF411 domain-containing protein [Pseudomonadota bacterium]
MRRRQFLALALVAPAVPALARGSERILTVWKTATCGCCAAWVEHMQEAGFETEVHDVVNFELIERKRELGVTAEQASCHTAVIDGYFVEGHVPAEDVARLLEERPQARGLAVPGMPVGSPGMEMGGRRDPYDTLLIGPKGGTTVFARHR